MSTGDLYRKHIFDHYKNPRNYGVIADADVVSKDANLSCGDEVLFHLKLDENKVSDIRFTSRSCAICKASASMLSEIVKGKDIESVRTLREEDVIALLGGPIDPQRQKCALLPLSAIKKGLEEYERKGK